MHRTIFTSAALCAAYLLTVPASLALSSRSQWISGDFSRVRLLMSPANEGASVDGGVEIQLEPGWHTYWRVPGDAGVPPQFDFSRSQNVAEVIVHYPVPERYNDGPSVSIIYKDRVVFPLTVRPADPDLPVSLALDFFYGACADVCIPVKAAAEASLVPGDKADPLAKIAIAEFKQKLPQAPTPDFAISSVTRDADVLTIKTVLPTADLVDLFVEGPSDWFIGQPELVARGDHGATFRLSLKGVPKDAKIDGRLNFLLVAGGQGVLAEGIAITP